MSNRGTNERKIAETVFRSFPERRNDLPKASRNILNHLQDSRINWRRWHKDNKKESIQEHETKNLPNKL